MRGEQIKIASAGPANLLERFVKIHRRIFHEINIQKILQNVLRRRDWGWRFLGARMNAYCRFTDRLQPDFSKLTDARF
jgi:hypothetical protein